MSISDNHCEQRKKMCVQAFASDIDDTMDIKCIIRDISSGAHLVNLQKPWRRIRKAAGLDDVRLHDLRHSFASVAASSGMSLIVIGALLGHSQPQTTDRYAHLSADPLKEANDAIGGRIATAMNSRSQSDKVVPIKPSRRG